MLNKVRTYFKEGFTYTGIEVVEVDGSSSFSILELKKSKNELLVVLSAIVEDVKDIPSKTKKNHPIFLCINTANVITKQVANTNSTNPDAIVNDAFPDLDLNNFYYEVIQISNGPIVTISKRNPIDKLIANLKELKIQVSQISLGISPVSNVIGYLEEENITLSNHVLKKEDGQIAQIASGTECEEKSYDINGLNITSKNLLSFAQILGHLNKENRIVNYNSISESLEWDFKNQRIFNQVLKYSLFFFVALLLANFFVYNSYHEKVAELNLTMAATSSKKNELSALDESVKRKQERVETLSSSSNSKATYYLDRFAQQIPSSILLSEIKYQPLAKPVRESKSILLDNGIVLVSGISKDVDEFSFWVEELEKLTWVSSVETLDYDFVSKNTSAFLIEIGFHEN